MQNTPYEKRTPINWVRTGKSHQEPSENGKGIITLEEERAGKKRRIVQTGYVSSFKKKTVVEEA